MIFLLEVYHFFWPYATQWWRPKTATDFTAALTGRNSNKTSAGNQYYADCKWERLILNNFRPPNFQRLYICIGLATPFNGIEYPQVIGIHSLPDVNFPESYPD